MNQIYNKAFFHVVLAFLSMITTQLSAQVKEDLKAGKITLDDEVLEVKKEISGGATIDLIDGTTERIDGICSFDKDRLKTGRVFVFDRISIGYGTGSSSALEGDVAYSTAAPKELQNAVFIINQDGREVLRMPFRDVHNILTGQKAADEYSETDSLRYLSDDRTISIQLKFPPSVVLPSGTHHYIYLRLKGLQTKKKPNA